MINDYIKVSGNTHHTQLHKTFTKEKKTSGKGKTNKGKPKLVLSCLIISQGEGWVDS